MIPLCVDLDDTLIQGDTLWVSICGILRSNPLDGIAIVWNFLRHGRAYSKDWMAGRYLPAPETLSYHTEVLDWLKEEKAKGRHLIMVTGAHRLVAEPIARYIGLFEEVIATANGYNLSGLPKAQALVKRYGDNGYDYAGNSHVDLPVWSCARHTIIVNASRRVTEEARKLGTVEREFPRPLKCTPGLDSWT